MVIAAENSLIPYAGRHYPVQAYDQDRPVANHERQQRGIEGKKFFKQPQPEIRSPFSHLDCAGNSYDFKLFVQQPAFEQVGLLVDIYA